MINSAIVEIAIGLILLYLVLGLLCTSINEYLAQLLSLRGENLAMAIRGMFVGADQERLAKDILDHPLVVSLSRRQFALNLVGKWGGFKNLFKEIVKLPSSIPKDVFSKVLLELKADPAKNYDPGTTKVVDTLETTTAIETWFDEAMSRATSWYKRKAQVMSFLVSFTLVFLINADTIVMADRLANAPAERLKLTAYASQLYATPQGEVIIPDGLEGDTLSFLGWEEPTSADPRRRPTDLGGWLLKIFGLSLTAFAACLGAPFWFDLLSKFMTVRTGGKKPVKEDSKP